MLVGREVVHSCSSTYIFGLYLKINVVQCVRYVFKFLFTPFLVLMVVFAV